MKQMLRTIGRATALGLCLLACGSCSDAVRQGRSSSYLVIDLLTAQPGGTSVPSATVLQSDVYTHGVAYEDPGQVTLHVAMRDPGTPSNPAAMTTTNAITVTSYHVAFTRADGRNTPGVDVPYAFDGAVTGTVVGTTSLALTFVLVRAQAKLEPPLLALRGLGGSIIISTIANVTFYGHDQAGNQVNVTGSISVNFADWADPQ